MNVAIDHPEITSFLPLRAGLGVLVPSLCKLPEDSFSCRWKKFGLLTKLDILYKV